MIIKRSDILLVDFEPVKGSEQGKTRPAVVVQNDIGNMYSNTTIIVPITSKIPSKYYPTDVFVPAEKSGLMKEGIIKCSQIATISVKDRVIKKIGSLTPETMHKVNEAIKTSLGLE
ncbi:MAG: type II toxin-antitoxin system PemK/MazF family toxin [Candidatus Diapherotrites archaeon]